MAAAPTPATPAAGALLGALADRPGATASELAQAAGIGRSTAAKLLATLAGQGRVLRQPGGHHDGRRAADRWTSPSRTNPGPRRPADRRAHPAGRAAPDHLGATGRRPTAPAGAGLPGRAARAGPVTHHDRQDPGPLGRRGRQRPADPGRPRRGDPDPTQAPPLHHHRCWRRPDRRPALTDPGTPVPAAGAQPPRAAHSRKQELRCPTSLSQGEPPGEHAEELLAMVAHELRQPLTALLGALMTLQHHTQALSVQQQELLGMAHRQGEQLQRLLDQLLAAASTDHLHALGTAVTGGCGRPGRGGRPRRPAGPSRPSDHHRGCWAAAGTGRPLAISRILGNLLDNAAAYSPRGEPSD